MNSALSSIIRAFLNSEFFRIIGYGCLLFVAVPCWVGLVLDWITR